MEQQQKINPNGDCNQPFNFTDATPMAGRNYYRIKVTERGQGRKLSPIILLQANGWLTSLYPMVIPKAGSVQANLSTDKGVLVVNDGLGRILLSKGLVKGAQRIDCQLQTPAYLFHCPGRKHCHIGAGQIDCSIVEWFSS